MGERLETGVDCGEWRAERVVWRVERKVEWKAVECRERRVDNGARRVECAE